MTKQLRMMSWPVRLPSDYFTGFLMINHPPVDGACQYGWGKAPDASDSQFLEELCDYFDRRVKEETLEAGSEEWNAIVPTHGEFVELLKKRDLKNLDQYLQVMFSKSLCHGTAQGDYFYNKLIEDQSELQKNTGFAVYDKFITLMEANAIVPAFSPEDYQRKNDFLKFYTIDPDDYIDMLERAFECDLKAPEFQGNHFGIQTARHGLYSDRDLMALGIAIHIRETYWNKLDINICDIGGGVGYLCYWLKKLGFTNITYIDLPTVAVSAMYFLHTNGVDDIKFISPKQFDGKYDLVVNFDGITTYGKSAAEDYINKITDNAKHFLSVNREIDEFRVSDICTMRRVSRHPFWLRRGYIHEDYLSENK